MPTDPERRPAGPDWPFWVVVGAVTGAYSILILSLLAVDAAWTTPQQIIDSLNSREIAFSIRLSLITSTTAALLALLVAIPAGYVLSRTNFRGKSFIDVLVDIPIVLPPLVIGLSLLILFRVRLPFTSNPETGESLRLNDVIPMTYTVAGVILAQFVIGAAFAVRTMRATFDHLPRRPEDVARVLGCSRAQAVWRVVLPSARRGMVTAFTLAWARSLGEFGPILVFAGATRMRTEVMPTTVFLELSVGNLEPALAVSLLMVIVSVFVLLVVRWTGDSTGGVHDRM